jgi:O-acetyl-ADP-ribose deacetylase (regulator of RNase III)
LIIEFFTAPLIGDADFNLADHRNYSEVASAFEKLFCRTRGEFAFNVVMQAPLKPGVIIPDAFKVMMRHIDKEIKVNLYVANHNIIDHLERHMLENSENTFECSIYGKKITIRTGDITHPYSLAIVNASNTQLKLGGGVSGAIKEKAGPSLQMELDSIAGRGVIENGEAILTGAHAMKGIKFIIHAACVEGSEDTVRKSIQNSLKICNNRSILSVAFPALGTGTGGMGIDLFAQVFFEEIKSFLSHNPEFPKEIFLILWTKSHFEACVKPFQNL